METTQVNRKQIDDNRAWFFAKDRSISLAQNCLYYLFAGGQANGAYMSMAFISETILSANATSITFSNIPQNFRHLMIFGQARTDLAAELDYILGRLNNDAAANYDFLEFAATSTGGIFTATRATSTNNILFAAEAANSRGNCFSKSVCFIPDYSVSGIEKNWLSLSASIGNLSADTDLFSFFHVVHWRNRNVITSIVMVPRTGTNIVTNSRFQLYGVL